MEGASIVLISSTEPTPEGKGKPDSVFSSLALARTGVPVEENYPCAMADHKRGESGAIYSLQLRAVAFVRRCPQG